LISSIDVLGIGLNATDTLLLLDEFPPYAGKVAFQKELTSVGGQVATAMVSCARLGLKAAYIGTVGDDDRGKLQRDSLEQAGVDISGLLVRERCANQTAYILIDTRTGERTVLWQRPDCLRLGSRDIRPEAVTAARMLHLDGYDVEAAEYAAALAKQHGIPVSLDVDTVYPDFERVLKNISHLVASSSWPGKWTGEEDPFQALPILYREYGLTIAAMTLGRHGALALAHGQWHYSPAFEVECADTTGAGDVFHGAFCYALLTGMTLDAALDFANAAAALNCTAIGARGRLAGLSEVLALQASAAAGKTRRHSAPEMARRAGRHVPIVVGAKP